MIMNGQFAALTEPFSIRTSTPKNRGRLRILMTEKACLKEVSMEGTQSQRLFIGFLLLHTEDRFRALSYKDSTTPLSPSVCLSVLGKRATFGHK